MKTPGRTAWGGSLSLSCIQSPSLACSKDRGRLKTIGTPKSVATVRTDWVSEAGEHKAEDGNRHGHHDWCSSNRKR